MKEFIEYVMGDDNSELSKAKASESFALHCLEREIAICAMTQTRLDQSEADRDSYKDQMIRAQVALHEVFHDHADKAMAWDVVAKKNAEIADLRTALKQIQRAANDPDCNERFRIDLINTIATEAIIA